MIPRRRYLAHLKAVSDAIATDTKGRALEELVSFLFSQVPGITIVQRNVLNAFRTEEIDVALWNRQHPRGFYFLPHQILIECKNWSVACGTTEVSYFSTRLENRGCEYGIFIAINGITGDPATLTAAHFELSTALSHGRRLIIITGDELRQLMNTDDLIRLTEKKLCQLVASGTIYK